MNVIVHQFMGRISSNYFRDFYVTHLSTSFKKMFSAGVSFVCRSHLEVEKPLMYQRSSARALHFQGLSRQTFVCC